MANITQAQKDLLSSDFLDRLNDDNDYSDDLSSLPLTQRLLIEAAAVFIQNARDNLQRGKNNRNFVNKGILFGAIKSTVPVVSGNSVSIGIGYDSSSPARKYGDFVNEGVRGIEDQTRAPQSPFSFKSAKGLNPSPSMRKALEEWIKSNRSKISNTPRNVDYRKAKGRKIAGAAAAQRKRRALSQSDNIKSLAYAIGTNIRKKGLTRSGFFDDAVRDTFNDNFYSAVAAIVGADVAVSIRKTNSLSK